jgi:hypothetical protein
MCRAEGKRGVLDLLGRLEAAPFARLDCALQFRQFDVDLMREIRQPTLLFGTGQLACQSAGATRDKSDVAVISPVGR